MHGDWKFSPTRQRDPSLARRAHPPTDLATLEQALLAVDLEAIEPQLTESERLVAHLLMQGKSIRWITQRPAGLPVSLVVHALEKLRQLLDPDHEG